MTNRIKLPEIAENQSGKYITHNEALNIVDAIMGMTAKSRSVTSQPSSPAEGDMYILGATHTGDDWDDYNENDIAVYANGGWVNVTPVDGYRVYVVDEAREYVYHGGWVSQGRASTIRIDDGISEPTEVSGYAIIYVDSTDGDLKIKFGDGTTKTIVTDD